MAFNLAHATVNNGLAPPAPQQKRQPRILFEFWIAGILIRIREGAVRHIFESHSKPQRETKDWPTIERNVSKHIAEMISSSEHIFLSNVRSTRDDSIMVYLKRPQDKMHHCFVVAHEGDNCYRLNTGYKKLIEDEAFSGTWINSGTGVVEEYWQGMQGVYTRGAPEENFHYWCIHGRVPSDFLNYQPPVLVPVPPPVYLIPLIPVYVVPQHVPYQQELIY
ncbi:hypothetical protein GCK72_011755 [Caenorhabditis remanei]|uniref:Uncharacterized protein n=1 Tax=Caenorhabditis remanei TaxID=31234 RepID=A0A6A5H8X7_CAERE|nr:hypothetical protein GCK72_011755 [Caenorhabditis remanei]KAF1763489.1 hypothetical protein GCK72_011755 [Caenorhabditis remanei]